MILHVTVLLCLLSAITTIVSFIFYIKARMTSREEDPDATPGQHARRIDALDDRERRFRTLHFISLCIFVLLGVLILVQLSTSYVAG